MAEPVDHGKVSARKGNYKCSINIKCPVSIILILTKATDFSSRLDFSKIFCMSPLKIRFKRHEES